MLEKQKVFNLAAVCTGLVFLEEKSFLNFVQICTGSKKYMITQATAIDR